MIGTVTVVVFDPTGKMTGTALALAIPAKSVPATENEREEKEEKETYWVNTPQLVAGLLDLKQGLSSHVTYI